MPTLTDYNEFAGRHWETGTVRNFFAYTGVKAPHTNKPYSEALLMGISGGAVMGYFSFAYEGYDPHVVIITRNTFSPFDTTLERLGIVQDIRQTTKADKGLANLVDTLADGVPAIVWADMYSLPYNALPCDDGMWGMMPIVVYGYQDDAVHIADRATVPLTVTPAELADARARVKKTKFRLLTLDMPNPDKLPVAVQQGIWDCIKLYTEKPPKGARHNFGLEAFQYWAKLLTKPKQRLSWAKAFPRGEKLYAGLTSTFSSMALFGQGTQCDAERALYADFLDEASLILNKPDLKAVAEQFRVSGKAWRTLSEALLPDEISPLQETRGLMLKRHTLFLTQGSEALADIQQIDARLKEIKEAVSGDFPLNEAEIATFQENLSQQVLKIHDLEQEAVEGLKDVMV